MIRYIGRPIYPKLVSRIMSTQNFSQNAPNKKIKLSVESEDDISGTTSNVTSTTTVETDTKQLKNDMSPKADLQSMIRNIINSKKPIWKPLVWIDCEMTGLNVFRTILLRFAAL